MKIFDQTEWLKAQNAPQWMRIPLADGRICVLETQEDEQHHELPDEVRDMLAVRDALVGPEQIIAIYDAALVQHIDSVAQARRYKNFETCALRAAYPGPWQAEGTAFAIWMDACNQHAYSVMNSVLAGGALPSIDDFIAAFPQMVWPE